MDPSSKFVDALKKKEYLPTTNYRRPGTPRHPDTTGTIDPLLTTSPEISHYQDDILNRRMIMEAFEEAKDDIFFRKVETVFWMGWLGGDKKWRPLEAQKEYERFEKRFGNGRVNDRSFSAVGYTQGIQEGVNAAPGLCKSFGVLIEGDVVYAGKQDLWSQEGWRIHKKVRDWYRSRGQNIPRRPMSHPVERLVGNVVLSEKDVPASGVISECIVANWKVKGYIIRKDKIVGHHSLTYVDDPVEEWLRNIETNVPNAIIIENNSRRQDMSYRRNRRWNRLVENTVRAVLNEEANVADFRSKDIPLKLSDVDSDVAQKIADSGNGETDAIAVDAKAEWSCDQLLPSQTSMNLSKACWFALGMIKGTMYGSGGPGGNLGCFVSKDNYLMDGHHRWIATVMVKPSATVKGFKCSWPAKELIAVLNTLSVGALGVPEGKPGSGGFENFKVQEEVEKRLKALYDGTHKMSDFGDGKKNYGGTCAGATDDQEAAKKVMEEATGKEGDEAIKAIAKMFCDNVTNCPTAENPPSDFPKRSDMPVIDDDYVTEPGVSNATATAMQALTKGEMDITTTEGPEDGEYKNESIDLRRWNKLAGILKD